MIQQYYSFDNGRDKQALFDYILLFWPTMMWRLGQVIRMSSSRSPWEMDKGRSSTVNS